MNGEWLFSEKELQVSASFRDGITWEIESELRQKSCLFIEDLSATLSIPKLTTATAQVFFHRFFVRQSFKVHDRYMIATACLFLSGKVEETPKRLNEIVRVYYAQRKNIPKMESSHKEFQKTREKILLLERIILHTMAFDLVIQHPYPYIKSILKEVGVTLSLTFDGNQESIEQAAWNFLNDSMRTCLCVRYGPYWIATAAVYLGFLYAKAIPEAFKHKDTCSSVQYYWTKSFIRKEDQGEKYPTEDALNDICRLILNMYQPNMDKIPARLVYLLTNYPTYKQTMD